MPSFSSVPTPTYAFFWPRNHEIKFILLSILDLRFLAFILRGVAVFAEISRIFAVSGTSLTPPPLTCYLADVSASTKVFCFFSQYFYSLTGG